MPFDRRDIRKGAFLTSDCVPPDRRSDIRKGAFLTSDGPFTALRREREHEALQRAYPHFEDVLKSVGPLPAVDELKRLAEQQRSLEARLALLRDKVKAVRKPK